MKKYEKAIEDRKALVARLTELTGIPSQYTFMPRSAYIVGRYTVEKDGTLVIEGEAEPEVIRTLLDEGLIRESETEEAPEEETVSEAPVTEAPVTEEEDEPDEEAADAEDELVISLPMMGHTAQSLHNFLNLMYSRGPLLNKALGTSFSVEYRLLEELEKKNLRTADEMLEALEDYCVWAGNPGMTGIRIVDEKISLTFHGPLSPENVKTCSELAAAMSRMAISQKRIQAKSVNDENEKYAMRIWLIRLGLSGDEYKNVRKTLMKNLTGHTAFRDEGEKERWTARQKEKRDALRAKKEDDIQ